MHLFPFTSPLKKSRLTAAATLLSLGLTASLARADSVVLEIGAFDGQNSDFEREGNDFNNAAYYFETGDYTATTGLAGSGENYPGPDAEILQDGPEGSFDVTLNGFPRAVVPGRSDIDIFFQLTTSEAASTSLLLETDLFGQGRNSSHDLTFYLNNIAFHREYNVRTDTKLKLYIPRNIPGMTFVDGPNVLSVRRSGGGKVDPDGFDEPWIQFDAFKLTAEVTSPTELIWQIGNFDNSQAEFEPEFSPHNNPQYYLAPGDYTAVRGRRAAGEVFAGPGPELLKDPEGDGSANPEGFPRALTGDPVNPGGPGGRPVVDIYFQLTAAQAAKEYLSFKTVLRDLGPNSSHDVRAYLNGTPIAIGMGITKDTPVDVLIPRLGVRDAGMGPSFHEGTNVLSMVRTGGGLVDPQGALAPYIQMDALSLETALAPAAPEEVDAFQTLVSVGYIDVSPGELEQESDAFNNPHFYTAAGDYSLVQGKSGVGDDRTGLDPEIWQDGTAQDTWATTIDGFPRAVIVDRPYIDMFFQAGASAPSSPSLLTARLIGPGPGSTHDLKWFINGEEVFSQEGVAADSTDVMQLIPAGVLVNGSNVLSLERTGGVDSGSTWLSLDFVELVTQFTQAAALPPFNITGIFRAPNGSVSLTWESEVNAKYTIRATSDLAGTWDLVAEGVDGEAGTTSYTDSFVPANATRRFYKIIRTR